MTGVSRRAVLAAAGLGLVAAALEDGVHRGPTQELTIWGGEVGGLYLEFPQLLAASIMVDRPDLHVVATPTRGSLENLARLAAGGSNMALVLADTALAAIAGSATAVAARRVVEAVPLTAIGRVYENYVQLMVLADSPIHAVEDLAGGRIAVGATGSGVELIGNRMLAGAGIAGTVRVTHLTLPAAAQALQAHTIDALLWSGGVPTLTLTQLSERTAVRLVPLDPAFPRLSRVYGSVYESVTIPPDAYGQGVGTATVGVANLLVCAPDADPDITASVARVLVTRAAQLVPDQTLGTQFLDPRSLITTGGVTLHPGAAAAYKALHG